MNPYGILFGLITDIFGSVVKTGMIVILAVATLIYLGYDPIGMIETYVWDQLIGDVIP